MITQNDINAFIEEATLVDKHYETMMMTQDPDNHLMDGPIPALTTLLINVCNNDSEAFGEATRLIALFMEKVLENQ